MNPSELYIILLCYLLLVTATKGTAPEGSACVFPFLYDGVVYTQCTTVRNEGIPWCSTEYDYSINKLWGNCQGEISDYSCVCIVLPNEFL